MSNALVLVASANRAPAALRAGARPNPDFLAQLIATATRAPQTCARRRIAPAEAMAIYSALDTLPARLGQALSRML